MKGSLSTRAKHDPALLRRILANPGLRSKLPTAMLPEDLRAKRQLNARLSAPVVPGSSMTYGDAARQANAQTQVKYGSEQSQLQRNLGTAQAAEHDIADWYQQYQNDLAQHARNTQAIGQQATTDINNLAQGIRGLDPANPDATAQNAANVRQALIASFAGQQTGANAANATYADTLANVVAPGQKLQARAQTRGKTDEVRQALLDLATERGAFNLSTRQQIASDESKNVLAQEALAGTTANQQTTQTISAARAAETARHNKASESNTAAGRKAAASAKAGAVNKYGYTNGQWQQMSVAERQKVIKAFKNTGGKNKSTDPATQYAKDFYSKYGVKPAPTAAVGNAKSAIQTAQSYVNELKGSGNDRSTVGQVLLQGRKVDTTAKDKNGKAITKTYPKTKGLWLTVALDLAYLNGKISAGTANRLHSAGYSVKLLGLQTPAASSSTYAHPPKPATTGSRGDS